MPSCRNRAHRCERCLECAGPFYGPEGDQRCREAWIHHHDTVECLLRLMSCSYGCGARFMPAKLGQAEEWLASHLCPVPCDYCQVMIEPGPKMEEHVAEECLFAPVECPECLERFVPVEEGEGQAWLEEHVCKEGLCPMCKQSFTGAQLLLHAKECPCRPIDCDLCGETLDQFTRKLRDRDALLASHRSKECPMREARCNGCEEVYVPSSPEDRETWGEAHQGVCECRDAACLDCGAGFVPKKRGQRDKWLATHAEQKCPMRAITCEDCHAAGGKFKRAGEREEWMGHHREAVCVYRPAVCERCGEVLRSKDADQLEHWRHTHR